jgi:hypothetical protein
MVLRGRQTARPISDCDESPLAAPIIIYDRRWHDCVIPYWQNECLCVSKVVNAVTIPVEVSVRHLPAAKLITHVVILAASEWDTLDWPNRSSAIRFKMDRCSRIFSRNPSNSRSEQRIRRRTMVAIST